MSVACAGIGDTERDTKRSRTAGGGRTQGVAGNGSVPCGPQMRSRRSQFWNVPIQCRWRPMSRGSRRPCRMTAPRGSCRQARNVLVAFHARGRPVARPQTRHQAGSQAASRRAEAKAAGVSARSKPRLGRGVLHPRRRPRRDTAPIRTSYRRNPSQEFADAPVRPIPRDRGPWLPDARCVRWISCRKCRAERIHCVVTRGQRNADASAVC